MLPVFLTAPVLGAIADFSASKKRFLFYFCYSGVFITILLYWVGPGDVWLGILLFILVQCRSGGEFGHVQRLSAGNRNP